VIETAEPFRKPGNLIF